MTGGSFGDTAVLKAEDRGTLDLLAEKRRLLAENDRLNGRILELEARIRQLEDQVHGRDLGDEDDSHRKWYQRLFR